MSETIRSAPPTVSTDELQDLLQVYLNEHQGRRVVNLVRRPSEYRSSYELDEIDAQFDDGSTLELVWKQTGRSCLNAEAINAKPEFLYDPLREIDAYRQFLASNELGTPACYGAIVDSKRDLYGVLLERVSGLNLSFIGDLSIWQEAARWLARLHDRFAALARAAVAPPHLLVHDRRFFRIWIDRALQFRRRAQPNVSHPGFDRIMKLTKRYDTAVDRLIRLPKSLIHGEFFASNILVDQRALPPRICPVDWETAGIGPCSLDLAALVAGSWTDGERQSMLQAYFDESTSLGRSEADFDRFTSDVELCRLHLAITMLGWSDTWQPDAEHSHDWLADAIKLSDELGLI